MCTKIGRPMIQDLALYQSNATVGSLEAYIYRVNQIPMLSLDEEIDFAERYRDQNDLAAARSLVMAHLRFVVRVASGYSGYGLNQADLIQEGNIGLMKAVRRFDPSVGVRLVSFAVHCIKAEIHEFIIRNWRIVKVATTKAQRKLFFKLRNAKKRLGWFSKQEIADVADALNVSAVEVERMEARLNANDVGFDAPDDADADNSNAVAPVYYLEDHRANPALQLELLDNAEQGRDGLHLALQQLDERSQEIIQARWLSDGKATLKTLADKYQVSQERIRQLEKNAMLKLRAALQEVNIYAIQT